MGFTSRSPRNKRHVTCRIPVLALVCTIAVFAGTVTIGNASFPPVPDGSVKGSASGVTVSHTFADPATAQQSALDRARSRKVLFNHQSVGNNILGGLDALAGDDATRFSLRRTAAPAVTWYSQGGTGDYTSGSNGDPASKVNGFKNLITDTYGADVNVAMMKFCYVDNVGDVDSVWAHYRDTMLSLESQYPGITFIWWTMPLQTTGNQFRDRYNEKVRSYASTHGKFLLDIADIESHDPSGNAVTQGGYEAMYTGYSADGGHLNDTGSSRMARAWWAMMLAVSGDQTQPTPTVTAAPTATSAPLPTATGTPKPTQTTTPRPGTPAATASPTRKPTAAATKKPTRTPSSTPTPASDAFARKPAGMAGVPTPETLALAPKRNVADDETDMRQPEGHRTVIAAVWQWLKRIFGL